MRVDEMLKKLDLDGWMLVVSDETVHQLRRHGLRSRITIVGRLEDELSDMQIESILRGARLRKEDL